ncbi:GyrI-like domain-containing protein [Pedobacter sp. KR3-3]|uniref:GyrI-like domain-containing protein n=1 Tax=Pedobacter albus TaxID=3113905 RepID=A0ABU7I3F7_9SPHI|nr:GyrI-like domain-containing protein [Pedobacter sp. KR3-3]MEE1943985.1 GyrI-like domain-containing protein [Pedobacter sp. KR3-3]
MEKLELTKQDKAYYSAGSMPALKNLAACNYLSIAGKGDPEGRAFQLVLQALYSVAYSLKFSCKAQGNDFVVPKLEGMWNFEASKYKDISMADAPLKVPRSEWNYQMLIRMPDFVSPRDIDMAKLKVMAKKGLDLVKNVSYFQLPARTVVEMMHFGPFSTEPQSLLQLQQFIEARGLESDGLHHEVYLSNFNTVAPEKLKTILREPIKPVR